MRGGLSSGGLWERYTIDITVIHISDASLQLQSQETYVHELLAYFNSLSSIINCALDNIGGSITNVYHVHPFTHVNATCLSFPRPF